MAMLVLHQLALRRLRQADHFLTPAAQGQLFDKLRTLR